MSNQKNTQLQQTAAERAEREEMFGFHPEILAATSDLPRKSDGSSYTARDEDHPNEDGR